MCTPCVHHEEPMSLDVIPNPNSNLDSITWLPGHVLFLRCRLINYYLIYVRLALTLAKVCPHSRLITIANNSTSMLVINAAWWTVLMRGWLATYKCDTDVMISFLMLASVTTKAMVGEEEIRRTISSSFWTRKLSFSFLLTRLKEKQSEKLSVKWKPGVNSWLRGEKDGKIP